MKIRLAILGEDQISTDTFVSSFNAKYPDQFEIFSFTVLETALEYIENEQIDVFLAEHTFSVEADRLPKKCGFAWLGDTPSIELYKGYPVIYKFQEIEFIYSRIRSLHSEHTTGMCEAEDRRERQCGAIVVEATIALSTFMFLIVIILSIVNICLAQAKVGTLINGVAKDLSYYSYLYSITGVGDKEASIHNGSKPARDSITTIQESETLFEAIGNISDAVFDSEFWKSMGNLVLDEAIDAGKGAALNPICQKLARQRLEMSNNDADTYLRKLGIEDGVSGLNFTCSEFCNGGSDKIKVVCVYQVHILRLLNVDKSFHFCQTAETRAWRSAGTLLSAYNASKPEGDDSHEEEKPEESSEEEDSEEEDAPEDSAEERKPKETVEYVKDNTHNGSSNQVMLGQMDNGTGLYAAYGFSMDMTYLSFSEEDWEELSKQGLGKQSEVINQYMQDQEYSGKTFYMQDDPEYATGRYYDQVEWLRSHGYHFEYNPGIDLYVAVRD